MIKNIKISLLLPSRDRPNQFNRLIDSINKTTKFLKNIELISYHDNDDLTYQNINFNKCKFKNIQIVSIRNTMGFYNTACLKKSSGDIIILINDDLIFRTSNWDTIVTSNHKSFNDEIYLSYGNDLFKGESLCTFPILSRKTILSIQDPFPIQYQGLFIDTHIMDIFKILEKQFENRIKYLPNFVLEHMHHRLGKSEKDQTYKNRDRFKDDATFLTLFEMRKKSAENLVRVIKGLKTLKIKKISNIDIKFKDKIKILFQNYLLQNNYIYSYKYKIFFYFIARILYSFVQNKISVNK